MDNPLVQLDPGLYFWTIAVFTILLSLLWKFAWGPLLAALEERQAGIRKSLDDADTAKRELAELQSKTSALIGKARTEADAILSEARADGARIRQELRDLAQQEAQAIKLDAQQQIQLERDRTVSELRREAVELSVMIASKLIRRNLTREDNAALIDEALQQVDPAVFSSEAFAPPPRIGQGGGRGASLLFGAPNQLHSAVARPPFAYWSAAIETAEPNSSAALCAWSNSTCG